MNRSMVAARLRRVLAPASIGAIVLLVTPLFAAASGTPTWTLQNMANPVTFTNITSVSCQSTVCIAAGSQQDPNTGNLLTLAETWSGASWTVMPTPNPTGSYESQLSAVSCTWATACTAVGWSDGFPLVERWNAGTWAIQTSPVPVGTTSAQFLGVSCPRSTTGWDCEAVGIYYDSTGAQQLLAERWDGAAWTVQPIPLPSGGMNGYLSGASCTSPTACTAVGYFQTSSSGSTYLPLIERWNGTTWAIQANPASSSSIYFKAVSCLTVNSCIAVGRDSKSPGHRFGGPISAKWNGSSWTIRTSPLLGTDQFRAGGFNAVSCVSLTSCEAVAGTGGGFALEHWNGTAWTLQTAPSTPGLFDAVLSISCTSANACTAVGQADDDNYSYMTSFALLYS
jgi:hypothetical protein